MGPPRLAGGRHSLDFANTVGYRRTEQPIEFLTSYPVLIAWAEYTGTLSRSESDSLRELATQLPAEAGDVHRRAVALRDSIYRVFVAVAHKMEPAAADLDALARVYRDALAHARLCPGEEGLTWQWDHGENDLARPLWPVAWSAVDVLTREDVTRIKVCRGGDGNSCWWVFFDTTKNRIRRWCSMENCGSSAKSRRLTARRRAARTGHNAAASA